MTDITISNTDLSLSASVTGSDVNQDILLLHGISNSRDTWLETVMHLQSNYRVWTLDFRGHGHSDRATSYLISDYASDAAAILNVIGRPTIVIGHSLGGAVAAFLAQQPHPNIKAVFLEDPPIYLNEVSEWNKTILAKAFPILRKSQVSLQNSHASFHEFVDFAANSKSVLGGVVADHQSQRQVESNGSALQRHDTNSWGPALNMTMLAAMDTTLPLKVPVMLISADSNLGPAFLSGHDKRFLITNPAAKIVVYKGAPHRIHATQSMESRFLKDVESFVNTHST